MLVGAIIFKLKGGSMFGITVIFGICALITGSFIILELNWSIQNIRYHWNRMWGPAKIVAILLAPFCMMPVILDVTITLAIAYLLGTSGMMGMMVSMVVTSTIAGYLFYMRRKHNWRYI